MENRVVRVKVPASTANLGPGFDTVGMAFQLYTKLTMRLAEQTEVKSIGAELAGLPSDKSNLLYKVAAHLFELAGLAVPELEIEVRSEVPLTRGLGSSAAAIVGALAGANALAGEPFTKDQLFTIASRWEGHPDNVGASMFGGVVVAAMPEEEMFEYVPYVRLDVPAELKVLAIIPDFELATETARSALPEVYQRKDAVYNVSHSSLLVAALAQGRLELLSEALGDRLHQPYRTPLVPGLSEILAEATNHGALGAALSGAGPTMLCFYREAEQKQQILQMVERIMNHHQIAYQPMELIPDTRGVVIDVDGSPDA